VVVLVLLGETPRLIQVAKLPVGDPQPGTGDRLACQDHDTRQEADVVGLAVGIGGQRQSQPVGRRVGNQDLAAKEFARTTTHGEEAFGHLLDLLPIEDDEVEASQAGRDVAAKEAGGKRGRKRAVKPESKASARGRGRRESLP
jgi:hypothetical protein